MEYLVVLRIMENNYKDACDAASGIADSAQAIAELVIPCGDPIFNFDGEKYIVPVGKDYD